MQQPATPSQSNILLTLHRHRRKKRIYSCILWCLVSSQTSPQGFSLSPQFLTRPQQYQYRPFVQPSTGSGKKKIGSLIRRWNANVRTFDDSSSSWPCNNITNTNASSQQASTNGSSNNSKKKRRMSLMWCDRDKCKDVARERVVGKHNQIILNGPATGQVAYRWRDDNESTSPSYNNGDSTIHDNNMASILLLVKPDDRLFQQVAQILPQLTHSGIQVLLVPELAGKLKYTYGLNDEDAKAIKLFDPPAETNAFRRDRHVDDDEEDWVQDLWPTEPFPDLICTLGGDGLLIHASMLFQGPIPPILSIAGGSLGFLTCFEIEEMVDAVTIALGIGTRASRQGGGLLSNNSKNNSNGAAANRRLEDDELEVFPPNMPSYPYEPLMVQRPRQHWEGPQARATFGMDGIVCMTVRMRLDCRVVNPEGIVRERYNVLNEVVIDRGSSSYLAALECFCDDVHLTTVQADGVIFATPTGSTAYSMAAGGSVVHPAVPCILVTPICPHVLSFRSMVFPDHVVLRCYVPEDARSIASVAFDGKHRLDLHRGDSVQIQMSAYPVPTINRGDHSSDWLESLKRSFNFNTRPRQKPLQQQ